MTGRGGGIGRAGGRAGLVSAFAGLALTLAPGCFWFTTKHQGVELRRDVADLELRMAKQEESVDAKAKKLDESLEKATKLLARNSADLGAEVQKLADELATLRGQLADAQRTAAEAVAKATVQRAESEQQLAAAQARLEALEKKLVAAPATPATQPVASAEKDALYAGALRKLEAKQYEDARKDFRAFQARFPKDERAARAQFLIGESFFQEASYERAIAEYQRVIDTYAESESADDAFFRAGEAAEQMKWCTDARAYFGVLVQRHPSSPYVKQAKQKLDTLKKKARDKKVCQS